MIAPARTAAFHALRAVRGNRSDLPPALARSRTHLSDERDRSLAAEIVTGALRWQRSLDHLVEHFARRRLSRIDTEVLVILQLSLYQILHLSRVPAAAVVDDAVDLTRAAHKPSAAGFVNAVLRSVLRERDGLPLPPRPDDPHDRQAALSYLGVTHSHPDWLVSRWLDRHGFAATERWVQFNNTVPPLAMRANRLRTSREGLRAMLVHHEVGTEPTPHAPDGLVVTSGNPLRGTPDGSFFVQDEASQMIPLVVAARPGERVLDLCASPGGKATAMVADMNDTGLLVACDVRQRRIRLLRDTIDLSGARRARIAQVAPTGPLPFQAVFDRVVVDAPCSGLGTIRRDPDIRWKRSEADLPVMAHEQARLLSRAAEVVKPGGRLVYATCSSEPEENEQVVDSFLGRSPEFTLVDLHHQGPPPLRPLLDRRGLLRALPFAHGLEAFFAAALMRR